MAEADSGRKRPAYPWYPGDWRRDTALQSCSFEARALWRELLDVMHDGEPYGHLAVNGRALSLERLAPMIGLSTSRAQRYLAELEEAGVPSRTPDGVLFSRRMVRDEHLRQVRGAAGKLGGNPNLKGSGLLNHPPNQTANQTPTPAARHDAVAVAVAVAGGSSAPQTEDRSQEEPTSVESPEKRDSTAVVAPVVGVLRRKHLRRLPSHTELELLLQSVAHEARTRMGSEERRETFVELVFAYHALKTGQRSAILDDKRAARLATRLKENREDVSELLFASDGARKDRFLNGENDRGRKYLGFQTVFRDREQVERLAALGGYTPGKVHPVVAAHRKGLEASNGSVAD